MKFLGLTAIVLFVVKTDFAGKLTLGRYLLVETYDRTKLDVGERLLDQDDGKKLRILA